MNNTPPPSPHPVWRLAERSAQQPEKPALYHGGRCYSRAEYWRECCRRAALLEAHRPATGPFHIAVLLENSAEYVFLLGAAALVNAVLTGLNTTRPGSGLATDLQNTDCTLLFSSTEQHKLWQGENPPVEPHNYFLVDQESYGKQLRDCADTPPATPSPVGDALSLLIFTSGTSGSPKAVRMSGARLGSYSSILVEMLGLNEEDVMYCTMPLFHSNSIITAWCASLISGAPLVIERFSAHRFLEDVRRYQVSYCNYVGKALAYILSIPEKEDDGDNSLRLAYGNEAAQSDVPRFAERFQCRVIDGFGSTEGGVMISRTPDTPPGALGRAVQEGIEILDPETKKPCPPAQFDAQGRLSNAAEATGEIVNTRGVGGFEGYYGNPKANRERTRGQAMYWTGDLGYKDERGFIWFAGRSDDWLRVDGENFTTAPVERILERHPQVRIAVVYGVPDLYSGDQPMACLYLGDSDASAHFDAAQWEDWLAQQKDMSAKWLPRYMRVAKELPATPSFKLLKRQLRREAWQCTDPVWWRPERETKFRPLSDQDRQELAQAFGARGRADLVPKPASGS